MIGKYGTKGDNAFITAILRIIFFLSLSFLAVSVGVFSANTICRLDKNFVKNIDVENFKAALDKALPIINTTYNSGKSGISFTGEIKGFIKDIFEFDLSNPIMILNAQSSLFYSYYINDYKQFIAQNNENESWGQKIPDITPDTGKISNENDLGKDKISEGNNQEDGNVSDKGENELVEDASSISFEEGIEKRNTSDTGVISHGKIVIRNETSYKVDIDKLVNEPLILNLNKNGPKVLIYHTHTTESYIKNLDDLDKKDIPNRTQDTRYNVVRVGEELAQNLRKNFNIDVLHNGTVHDYPNYNSSYAMALGTVDKILKGNPSIGIVLDIHRDGLGNGTEKLRTLAKIKDKNLAQIMFVVGTDGLGLNHPKWQENLKLALKLQQKLNEQCPGLAKPVYISKCRYNQHVSCGALIVEVGGDGNTVNECLKSVRYLAEALNAVFDER